MNLSYLSKTDLQLQELRDLMSSTGTEARREIQRRKMVGYSDGTMIIKIDDKAPMEEPESVVEQPQEI
tara:strand:+ start:951 stop:1154 length:204 start_codon:yes stop_codon:yes gene_type:complete